MNCQEFDRILNELVQPKLTEAALRETALAHSSACQLCAMRLANARSLAEGLKSLAATTEAKSAPSHVEDTLLAAFRQQTVVTAAAVVASPKAANVLQFPPKQNRRPVWALAAAAALLIAFGIFAASQLRKAPATPATKEVASVPNPSPTVELSREQESQTELAINASSQTGVKPIPGPRFNLQVAAKQTDDGFSVSSTLGEFTPLIEGQEIATDFLPLAYETADQPMESGQLIRVQMPRTALASFGLPINMERASGTVKADLLLADDGSARAIRFIR